MGLDYSIDLEIRNKKTRQSLIEVEVAYWRRCWGLAYELNDIARRDEFKFDEKIEYDADEWHFVSKPSIIPEVINSICAALPNVNALHWQNSFWEVSGARANSARELSKLIRLETFINSKYEYKDDKGVNRAEYDFDEIEYLIDLENQSYFRTNENGKKLTDEDKQELMDNPNDYEFIIHFYFSY